MVLNVHWVKTTPPKKNKIRLAMLQNFSFIFPILASYFSQFLQNCRSYSIFFILLILTDLMSMFSNCCSHKFSRHPSRGKGIVGRVFKICRIYSSVQNLAWEYFWPHFEKQDSHHGHFSTFSKEFSNPSRAKGKGYHR